MVLQKKDCKIANFLTVQKRHNRALKEWFYRKKIARSPIFLLLKSDKVASSIFFMETKGRCRSWRSFFSGSRPALLNTKEDGCGLGESDQLSQSQKYFKKKRKNLDPKPVSSSFIDQE